MKKMLGEERRDYLLNLLKKSNTPLKGTDLSHATNVSRQVIVNDMNLLKARNEPIIATSQGYVYMAPLQANHFEKTIVCTHSSEQTRDELYAIVDLGVTVQNVIVQHPLYGEITASLMVSNRLEVDDFLNRAQEANAIMLSTLTDGTHLHVISAPSEQLLNLAEQKLRDLNILVEH